MAQYGHALRVASRKDRLDADEAPAGGWPSGSFRTGDRDADG